MEEAHNEQIHAASGETQSTDGPVATPVHSESVGWQVPRFLLHLAAVYGIVLLCAPWLSSWLHNIVLPILGDRPSSSRFEFLYTHLLAFSFAPAFVAGFVNARFRHAVAQWVWTVPLTVLAYRIATFPHVASVLFESSWVPAAFHHYFDGGFAIPEYHNYYELFQYVATNPDALRGMDQLHYTGPLYAAIGYSASTWISLRWRRSMPEVADSLMHWHQQTRLPEHETLQQD